MSFLFKNTKLYIALALMLMLNVFLYLKLDSTNAKLEKSQSDLNLALSVNNELTRITQELKIRHEQELKALFHANTQKNQIKTRVDDVKTIYLKAMKLIPLSFLMLCLIGCGSKTQVLTKIQIQKVQILNELLEFDRAHKPIVQDEKDILKAYSELFYHYKQCEINMDKIKELNVWFYLLISWVSKSYFSVKALVEVKGR